MSSAIPEGHYPIRDFARVTGVNPATLRAWERRYGIIHPHRTPKGHRYFSDLHVERVRSILNWLDQGYPIRQVPQLLDDNCARPDNADEWQVLQEQTLQLIQQGKRRANTG